MNLSQQKSTKAELTDREILQEAVKKAVLNGFSYKGNSDFEIAADYSSVVFFKDKKWTIHDSIEVYRLLFDHDFAKAFWGEKPLYCSFCKRPHTTPEDCDASCIEDMFYWQFCLQQIVLEKNPIQYLKRFL